MSGSVHATGIWSHARIITGESLYSKSVVWAESEIVVGGDDPSLGYSLTAEAGIRAGGSIFVCGLLKVKLLTFAGVVTFRQAVEEDRVITCTRYEGPSIAYGTLVETDPVIVPVAKRPKLRIAGKPVGL